MRYAKNEGSLHKPDAIQLERYVYIVLMNYWRAGFFCFFLMLFFFSFFQPQSIPGSALEYDMNSEVSWLSYVIYVPVSASKTGYIIRP